MMLVWLLVPCALTLDAWSLLWLVRQSDDGVVALEWLLAHAGACWLFAAACARVAPKSSSDSSSVSYRDAMVVAFGMAFFLPLLGMVGLLALVYPALGRRAVPEEACQWRHPGVPALAEPQARNGEPASGLRNLDAMLRHASDASTRMDALMRALKLSDARAAALLRKALKDTDEEVRLLAYALLNRKEKAIEARIHARRTALDTLDPHESFAHRKALAYDYWELAHLGGTHRAADSPLNAYVCEYAQSALALNPVDGGLQLLLGRALILQGQLAAAERCLLHAQQCGMGTDKTAPYLAEVAYLSRQFGSVRQLLQGPGSAAQHPKLENAWNFWEGVRREATAS